MIGAAGTCGTAPASGSSSAQAAMDSLWEQVYATYEALNRLTVPERPDHPHCRALIPQHGFLSAGPNERLHA